MIRTRYNSDSEGSALLVALIIMGILMTVAIGVSELLLTSYKDNRQLIDRTNAWYEAESGIENALFKVTHNPPGYEDTQSTKESAAQNSDDATRYHSYTIEAAGVQVPATAYLNQPAEDQFSDLPLGQTVTIPLFSGSDTTVGVTDMKIEFDFAPAFKNQSRINPASEIPILRWKIFGRNKINKETEVISDIAPERDAQMTCIPTNNSVDVCPNQFRGVGKYFQKDGDAYLLSNEFPISQFLLDHSENFLLLTNMIDVNFIDSAVLGPDQKKQLAVLKYKVTQLNDRDSKKLLSLPTAHITADGFARNTKQSIDIDLDRERSLPVFNYALYRTE